MQNKLGFIFIFEVQPTFSKGERYDCNATLRPSGQRISEEKTKSFLEFLEREYLNQRLKVVQTEQNAK